MKISQAKIKFIEAWITYHRVQAIMEALKPTLIEEIGTKSATANGWQLSVSERPVFSAVTLDEARKIPGGVKKVPNTTVLNEYLHQGGKINGVRYTKYLNVQQL